LTDVSEVFFASITREIPEDSHLHVKFKVLTALGLLIALLMEATSTSETSVNFYQSTGSTSQKTAIFILAAVRI
jgi:hypothetical protein